jgi:CSLREA domain-containing protein
MKTLIRKRKTLRFEALEDRTLLSLTAVADFENLWRIDNPQNYWDGKEEPLGAHTFVSGPCEFENITASDGWYTWWGGFGYSQVTDNETPGWENEMSAFPGIGANLTPTYGIGYYDSEITLRLSITDDYVGNYEFSSLMVSNTTYAALSILNGDGFADPFSDGDHFELIIMGKDANGQEVGNVEVILADYRDGKTFVLDAWDNVDISSLKEAVSLEFTLETTGVNDNGLTTPFYFAVDEITLTEKETVIDDNYAVTDFEDVGSYLPPESFGFTDDYTSGDYVEGDSIFHSGVGNFTTGGGWDVYGYWYGWAYSNTTDTTTEGYTNQFSAYTGVGADDSPTYGVAYYLDYFGPDAKPKIIMDDSDNYDFDSIQITNTTYAALSMLNGDGFAKQFGGTDGNDKDWFLLTITGYDGDENYVNQVEFYLADYRFVDNYQDYIVDTWTTVDLSSLQGSVYLEFNFTSSDINAWGMNTPAYCAIDNLALKKKDYTAQPTSIVVTTAADVVDPHDGVTSLREAITAINEHETDLTTVTFADDVAHVKLTNELTITTAIAIEGNGVILDANHKSRIFTINADIEDAVVISGLTLTNGYAVAHGGYGGAIYQINGNVTLTETTFKNNYAQKGGAYFQKAGTSLFNCNTIFEDNSGSYYGGAFYLYGGTAKFAANTQFLRNEAKWGGAIYLTSDGSLYLDHVALTENAATWGGAMYQASGTLEATYISLVDNSAEWGGGLYAIGGTADLINPYFSAKEELKTRSGVFISKTTDAKNVKINGHDMGLRRYLDEIDEEFFV